MKYGYCAVVGILALIGVQTAYNQVPANLSLSKSAIDEIGSTDEQVRRSAVMELLSGGPGRLQEIQQAEQTLREILDRWAIVQTPNRDVRPGHGRFPEQVQEAVDFFVDHQAITWAIQALRTEDELIQYTASEALVKLNPRAKQANRIAIVNACLPFLEHRDVSASIVQTSERAIRRNAIRMTAEIIEFPLAEEAIENTHGTVEINILAAPVLEAAKRWLTDHRSSVLSG